ncbi:MAG: hypothetical protein IJW97_02095 [Clostridia bacterium]|nr:hypothetical protein [Clostridia bacterium]
MNAFFGKNVHYYNMRVREKVLPTTSPQDVGAAELQKYILQKNMRNLPRYLAIHTKACYNKPTAHRATNKTTRDIMKTEVST